MNQQMWLEDNYNNCFVNRNQTHFKISIKISLEYFSWTIVITLTIYNLHSTYTKKFYSGVRTRGTSNTPQLLITMQQDSEHLPLKILTMCTLFENALKYYIDFCLTQSRKCNCHVTPRDHPDTTVYKHTR